MATRGSYVHNSMVDFIIIIIIINDLAISWSARVAKS